MSKAAKVDAYMPLWIGDYLADTMGFKALAHGAYLLLLMAYWRQRAPLPDDDDELAGIARCTAAEWKALRPKLARKFQVADGLWRHGRADDELASALERKENAVKKAKAGAQAKWSKGSKHGRDDAPSNAPSIATSNAPSIGEALPKQCPSTSPSPTESSEAIASGGDAPPAPPPAQPAAPPPDDPGQPASPVDVIFALGLPMLTKAGIAEKQARSFLGLLRKNAKGRGGDPFVVAALERCAREQPLQPLEFLQGCFGPAGRGLNRQEALEASNRKTADEWAEGVSA